MLVVCVLVIRVRVVCVRVECVCAYVESVIACMCMFHVLYVHVGACICVDYCL